MDKSAEKPIDMAPPPGLPRAAGGFRYFMPFLLLWLLLAAAVIWWIWAQFGDVNSSHAVLEGEVITVTPALSAPVAEVFVQENQEVAQGQPLARLEGGAAYGGMAAGTAGSYGAGGAAYGPEDAARGAYDAKAREEAFVRRIAEARQAEAAAVRELEVLSVAHVKAQLEVRSLEAMGVNVPRESYDRARQTELAARVRMEAARSAREETSRVRAAVEAELSAMRAENRQRGLARPAQAAYGAAPPPAAENLSLVLAPAPGRVVGVVSSGTLARRGYPLMTIIPPGGAGLWVMAYFREKPAASVKPGQKCKIVFEGGEHEPMSGTVHDMGASSGGGLERQIPVRITLDYEKDKSRPALNMGMKASVVVHTRPLPTSLLPAAWMERFNF